MIKKLLEWTCGTIIYYLRHYELSKGEKLEYLQKVIDYCEERKKEI